MGNRQLVTIGWLEHVEFPEWGVEKLIAKIDTGARTSSIHAENITEREDGQIEFDVVTRIGAQDRWVHVTCPYIRKTNVRSSSGRAQIRYVVRTTLAIGGIKKIVEITLSSRKKMLRRVLVGRTTLTGTFVVDVSQVHLA
jgi:hypothetical protein